MSCGCAANSDKIFEKLGISSYETKRWLVGKYSGVGDTYETNFEKSVYKYNGQSICRNKFNFTIEGTKCYWCNSFSFLFEEGEIIPDHPILIESGVFRNRRIVIKRFPLCQSVFGKYIPDNILFTSRLLSVIDVIKRQRMINQSCDVSHKLAIASLINNSEFPFKSNILGAWLCEYSNTVEILAPQTLMNTIFTDKMMRNTFFQLFVLSGTNLFSHGSPSNKNISILNERSKYQLGNTKLEMETTIFIEPETYSSFAADYNNRRLYFVGKESETNVREPNWRIQYKFNTCSKIPLTLTKSPCLLEYLSMRIASIKVTHELMNYVRKTGVNVFPPLYLFLYITIFLLNRSFFETFTRSNLYEKLSNIFLDDDLSKYMVVINANIGNDLNSDQIVDLLIESDIKIRLDSLQMLGCSIAPLYQIQ